MADMNTQHDETPQWDVALEALLTERCQKSGQPLSLLELKRISGHYNVRLDDVLHTLCKLSQHGRWRYEQTDGSPGQLDRDMCRLLEANHRLNDTQLERLGGNWEPVGS